MHLSHHPFELLLNDRYPPIPLSSPISVLWRLFISFALLSHIPIHPFSLFARDNELRSRTIFVLSGNIVCKLELNCTILCSAYLPACPIWLLSFSLPSNSAWVWCFIMTPSLLPQHQKMQVDATTTATASGRPHQPTNQTPTYPL